MFQFEEVRDWASYSMFPRRFIESNKWADAPLPVKSILPVLLCHAGRDGTSYPGELRIASLCGLSCSTVRNAIPGVYEYFPFDRRNTGKGRVSKIFRVPQKSQGFPFRHCVLTGGNWSLLSPADHNLYLTMRCFGNFTLTDCREYDPERYDEIFDGYDGDFPESIKIFFNSGDYTRRGFDIYKGGIQRLVKHSGLSRRAVFYGLKELTVHGMVEKIQTKKGEATWKVFLTPPHHYRFEELNRVLETHFQYIKKC